MACGTTEHNVPQGQIIQIGALMFMHQSSYVLLAGSFLEISRVHRETEQRVKAMKKVVYKSQKISQEWQCGRTDTRVNRHKEFAVPKASACLWQRNIVNVQDNYLALKSQK